MSGIRPTDAMFIPSWPHAVRWVIFFPPWDFELNYLLVESKPGHTTGGPGRGAQPGGGAGSGRTGYQQNCLPRRQGSPVPSKASKTRRLNVSPKARTIEIRCKPNAGTKPAVEPRPISGSSAVYPRFISGTRSALSSWLLNSGPVP